MSIWGKQPKEPFSVKPLAQLVALQLLGMKDVVEKHLSSFANDGFFIGYLAGSSNEFRRIANAHEDTFTVGKKLVEDVFGDYALNAETAVDNYTKLVAIGLAASKGDKARMNELMDKFGTEAEEVLKFNDGLVAGVEEISDFMKTSKQPYLLAKYLRDNYS